MDRKIQWFAFFLFHGLVFVTAVSKPTDDAALKTRFSLGLFESNDSRSIMSVLCGEMSPHIRLPEQVRRTITSSFLCAQHHTGSREYMSAIEIESIREILRALH